MGEGTSIVEALGLPGTEVLPSVQERMKEAFTRAYEAGRWFDRRWEELGDRTGVPTYHDIFGGSPELREWVERQYPDLVEDDEEETSEDDDEEKTEEDEDEGLRWWHWLAGAGAVGWYVWTKLDHDVARSERVKLVDIDGFELDGIPWTVEKLHKPGPPLAARVGDPMLHGGMALPGPGAGRGSGNVLIGGRGALTSADVVAACPMTNVVGLPHIPVAGSWTSSNGSVLVNGKTLLRNGDWIVETPGGNNPLVAGMPTVHAGPPARPCMVEEVEYIGLDRIIPGVERVAWEGGTIYLTGSFSWNVQSMLATIGAAGLVAYGGPLGQWTAGLIMKSIDGPEFGTGFVFETGKVTGVFGFETDDGKRHSFPFEVDPPDFSAGAEVEVDPDDPTKAKKYEEERTWDGKKKK